MGTFVERLARRLNRPAFRLPEGTGDACPPTSPALRRAGDGAVACLQTSLTASAPDSATGDSGPLLLCESEPLDYATQALAALATGRDVFLGNPHWTAAEAAAAEALCRTTLTMEAGSSQPPLTSGLGEGRTLRVSRGSAGTPRPTSEVQAPESVSQRASRSPGRVMIATGGSGGVLRFAIHTTETLTHAADALQTHLGGGPINSLCLLPLHHVSGFQQLVRALATDGECLLGDWQRIVAGQRPAIPATGDWMLSLVPTQLQRLIDDTEACTWLRRFTTILLGGAPAGSALLDKARAAGLPLAHAYGATETAAVFALQAPAEFLAGTSGLRPLSHAAVRILDPETQQPVAPGSLGRIEVTASSLFLGYWPERRPPGAWLTDDLGTLSADGRLHVLGRADAAINTGGEKVHPAEVEAALRATGAFSEVVVLGVADARWGETVSAYYPAANDPDLAAVERQLREQLSVHKLPRRWVPVTDWPRTTQGKTDRAALRKLR